MSFYVLLALWPLLMYRCYNRLSEGNKTISRRNTYLFWAMLPMFLAIGLRDVSLGADTSTYWMHFEGLRTMTLIEAYTDTRMEWGYVLLVKLISDYISSSPEIYQILVTLIYFWGFYSFAKLMEDDSPFLFIFFVMTLGMFTFMYTGIRQCIAISLCLYSFRFILVRKWWYFAFILLIAYNIHHSAILFVMAYPMVTRELSVKNFILYIIGLGVASAYLVQAQFFLNEQLEYNYEIEKVDSGLAFLSILCMMSYFAFKYIRKEGVINQLLLAFFNLNIVTLFFWFLRLQTRVAERPSLYFLPVSCALFAVMFKSVNNKSIRFVICSVALFLYVYRFMGTFKGFIPYHTFF